MAPHLPVTFSSRIGLFLRLSFFDGVTHLDGRTDIAQKFTVRCELRRAVSMNPDVFAIGAAQAVVHDEGLPFTEGFGVDRITVS